MTGYIYLDESLMHWVAWNNLNISYYDTPGRASDEKGICDELKVS